MNKTREEEFGKLFDEGRRKAGFRNQKDLLPQLHLRNLGAISEQQLSRYKSGGEKWPEGVLDAICEIFKEKSQSTDHPFTDADAQKLKGLAEPIFRAKLLSRLPHTPKAGSLPSYLPRLLLVRLDYFLGREEELNSIWETLYPGQIVVLWGPAGIGKTALAAKAIEKIMNEDGQRFPDGVYHYSFNEQYNIDAALQDIAFTFDYHPIEDLPRDAAKRALRNKQMLLFFENTENCDTLIELLEIQGDCGVLITTQRQSDAFDLHVPPIHVDRLPDDKLERLLRTIAGAKAADQDAVRQICEIVGGVTLAIDLIGRYLAESEEDASTFLEWLQQDPITTLDLGSMRLSSIRLLLSQSISHLTLLSQQILLIMGVLALLPIEFDFLAAILVELTAPVLKKQLHELVIYGLLIRAENRYSVRHGLIHTFARRSMATQLSPEYLSRIANYCLPIIQEEQITIADVEQYPPRSYISKQWTEARLHLLALISVYREREEWTVVDELARTIYEQLCLHDYWFDCLFTLQAGLAAARALQNCQEEVAWLSKLGDTYSSLGDHQQAIAHYQQGLSSAQKTKNRLSECACLIGLGDRYDALGDHQQAIAHYQQSLTSARKIKDRHVESICLGKQGLVYRALGQYEQAINYFQQALAIAHKHRDYPVEIQWLIQLGVVCLFVSLPQKAIGWYQQALDIARNIDNQYWEIICLYALGGVHFLLEQYEVAINCSEQMLTMTRMLHDSYLERLGLEGSTLSSSPFRFLSPYIDFERLALEGLGETYHAWGQSQIAIDWYKQALTLANTGTDYYGHRVKLLFSLGDIYFSLHQYQQVLECYQEILTSIHVPTSPEKASQMLSRLISPEKANQILNIMGLCHLELQQHQQAIEYAEQALAIVKGTNNLSAKLGAMTILIDAYEALGQEQQVLAIVREAKELKGGEPITAKDWFPSIGNEEIAIKVFDKLNSEDDINNPSRIPVPPSNLERFGFYIARCLRISLTALFGETKAAKIGDILLSYLESE